MTNAARFRLVLTIFLVLIIFLVGCQQPTPITKTKPKTPIIETKDGVKTYLNSLNNFTFVVCNNKEFEVEENSTGTNVALLGPRLNDLKRRISVTVVVGTLPTNTSFEDYLKNNVKEAEKNLAKFAVIDETTTTISSIAAKKSSFTYFETIGDQDYVFKDVLIVFMKDQKVYAIKYDVPEDFYNEYADCFNTLVSTFKFR
jgi:hypothetical protein